MCTRDCFERVGKFLELVQQHVWRSEPWLFPFGPLNRAAVQAARCLGEGLTKEAEAGRKQGSSTKVG